MSVYKIEKFLFDLGQIPSLRLDYAKDRASSIKPYELDEDEMLAVKTLNLKWLLAHGVNPLLLLRFNLTGQIPGRDAYLKLLREGP